MKYTKESLQNTWGVVESKEHAEFIVELASQAGFFIACGYSGSIKFFCTNNESLVFCRAEQNAKRERKQITIPLPPKAKEWVPKVGDDVAITSQHNRLEGKLLALTKEYAIISLPWGEQPFYLRNWSFEKPKSAQDLKIEELQTKLCNLSAVDNYILACDIVQGKVEGLSYE